MKTRDSKFFGKYEVIDNLDTKSKQKLKKYYEEFKMVLANKEKTKNLASYIKNMLSKK